jgi:hypothetical protein
VFAIMWFVGRLIPWEFLIDDRVDQNTEQNGLHKSAC